jgi:hypothetical protein
MAVKGKAREHDEDDNRTVSQMAHEHAGETVGVIDPNQFTGNGGNLLNAAMNDENSGGAGGTATADVRATNKRTDQEKRESFTRLASIRASNALDAMRGIGHLANTTSYLFDEPQVERMLSALESSLAALRKNFAKALEPKPPKIEGQRQKRGERNLTFRL